MRCVCKRKWVRLMKIVFLLEGSPFSASSGSSQIIGLSEVFISVCLLQVCPCLAKHQTHLEGDDAIVNMIRLDMHS